MVSFGRILTYTIKKAHPKSSVIQISDYETPTIKEADYIVRHEFTKSHLMFNRIESYIIAMEKYGPIIFLDPDMLVIKDVSELNKLLINYDFIVTKRKKNFPLKNTFMGFSFPEFNNKMVLEIMPYNGGFMACSNIETLLELKKIYSSLPSEYFFWYGDQISMKIMIDNNIYKTKIIDADVYNYTPRNENERLDNISIAHFKGKKKELLMKMLPTIYEKNIFDLIFNQ
jgi:hypothetical protein